MRSKDCFNSLAHRPLVHQQLSSCRGTGRGAGSAWGQGPGPAAQGHPTPGRERQ